MKYCIVMLLLLVVGCEKSEKESAPASKTVPTMAETLAKLYPEDYPEEPADTDLDKLQTESATTRDAEVDLAKKLDEESRAKNKAEEEVERLKEQLRKEKTAFDQAKKEDARQHKEKELAIRTERSELVRIALINSHETDAFLNTDMYKVLAERHLAENGAGAATTELDELLMQLDENEAKKIVAAVNVLSRYKGRNTNLTLSLLLSAPEVTPKEALPRNKTTNAHDTQTTSKPAENAGKEIWSFSSDAIHGSAVGQDGTVYITGRQTEFDNTPVTAIDGRTGKVLWTFDPKMKGKDVEFGNPAIGNDGSLFVGLTITADRELKVDKTLTFADLDKERPVHSILFCLDASTGKVRWQKKMLGHLYDYPCIGANSTLYIGNGDLHAINTKDGTIKWKLSLEARAPVFDKKGDVLLTGDGELISVNGASRVVNWNYRTGNGRRLSEIAIGDGDNIYFATTDGAIHAVNSANGTMIWKTNVNGPTCDISPVISEAGDILVATEDGICVLEANSGRKKTLVDTPEKVFSLTLGASNILYYGLRQTMHAISLEENRVVFENGVKKTRPIEQWSVRLPTSIVDSIIFTTDGRIFASTHDSCHGIFADSGNVLSPWPMTAQGPQRSGHSK